MKNDDFQKVPAPTDASLILTYRCPMRCKMCNIWAHPTKPEEEIKAADARSYRTARFVFWTHWRQVGWDTPGADCYPECGFLSDQVQTSVGER